MRKRVMCDYSLQHVKSRPAKVADKLVIHNFGTGTRGFCAPDDRSTAVCLIPGTELAFERPIMANVPTEAHRTAIFRQINKSVPYRHHDALELPGGQMVLLTQLCEGQAATVLQLPAQPRTHEEAVEQTRALFVG
jgi:hypothetical protein